MEQLEDKCQRRIETNTQTSHSDKQPRNVEHWISSNSLDLIRVGKNPGNLTVTAFLFFTL